LKCDESLWNLKVRDSSGKRHNNLVVGNFLEAAAEGPSIFGFRSKGKWMQCWIF